MKWDVGLGGSRGMPRLRGKRWMTRLGGRRGMLGLGRGMLVVAEERLRVAGLRGKNRIQFDM